MAQKRRKIVLGFFISLRGLLVQKVSARSEIQHESRSALFLQADTIKQIQCEHGTSMTVSLSRHVTMSSCGSVLALSIVLLAICALQTSGQEYLPDGCQSKALGDSCKRNSYEDPAQGKLFTNHDAFMWPYSILLCNNKPTLGNNPTQFGLGYDHPIHTVVLIVRGYMYFSYMFRFC